MTTKIMRIRPDETTRRKAVLKLKLRELQGVSRIPEELCIDQLADFIEQGTSSADRDLAVQRLDRQTRVMHDIEAALAKFEDGSYGACEQCDEPIAPKRLQALPWARLCVHCQSRLENADHRAETAFQAA